ncbi:hypothetical protein EV383_2576 [Pseudonocardia sediminis]|uniref:histidine kinase n=1 Tax=Pseudonocardia sediminis TaxID=1397368 RepID=A0A4Q7UUR8_PSEST|nr:ATP-binding protein [Pseudonocardia sediminis]RZT85697.1 hypothetical protein EV383_2576 [Pseudonocardia sediminis]
MTTPPEGNGLLPGVSRPGRPDLGWPELAATAVLVVLFSVTAGIGWVAGVAELAEPSRSAGLPVTVDVRGNPADPPGDADLFAQRVLVEALTNVVRHAGPTPTRVGVGHDPDTVVVTVQDAGPVPGHRPPTTGSGMGLVGMRERAALLGGSVQAGPHGAGWRVRAVLHRPAPD